MRARRRLVGRERATTANRRGRVPSAEWASQWRAAVALRDAGDLAGAADGFSLILAHDPFHDKRAEMADTFARLGESLLEKDPAAAARHLRQAVALSPDDARTRKLEARIAWLDVEAARAAGHDDGPALHRVLAFDPDHVEAKRALDAVTAQKKRAAYVQSATAGGAALGLALLLLLIGRLTRRRASSPPR